MFFVISFSRIIGREQKPSDCASRISLNNKHTENIITTNDSKLNTSIIKNDKQEGQFYVVGWEG